MSKSFILIGLIPVVLVAGFFATNAFIYQEKQDSNRDESMEPYRVTLSGEYSCLPKVGDGPHTMECAFGLRTDTGEYYAVDFNLMSQEHRPLEVGERFSANGTITPVERLSSTHWQQYDIEGVFSVTDSVEVEEDEVFCTADAKMCPDGSYVGREGPNCEFAACPNEPVACTMDAKMCPDGSYVGRQGPNCEFAACPSESPSLYQSVTIKGVTIEPKEVISDSRCPINAFCIDVGTVELKVVLSTTVSHGEQVLKLNQPSAFGEYEVTLTQVLPSKTQDDIPPASYSFEFKVE